MSSGARVPPGAGADELNRVARLRARSADLGLRMTPQRQVLLKVLGRMRHHPTADELVRHVRRILPSVSHATVYRNVQTLVEAGIISMLERAGGAVQYDANPEEHHHFVCTGCGQVLDVYLTGIGYAIDRRRSHLHGAVIRTCEIQLHGLCPACRPTGPQGVGRRPRVFSASRRRSST
jgi:Fe2+ or Zn2+ uptake regulation protein